MPKPLQERARLIETATTSPGHRLMQLISPGWGSSGYYSAEVLEQAVADHLFPAGTHMYADHDPEAAARGRSVKDLVSVTVTEGQIATDEQVAAGADIGAVVAEIRVAAPYRDLIDDIGSDIGVSIWGDATDITLGEAEGRRGKIIEGLAHIESVDWVTHAGRGGKVLSVLESALATRRAKDRGVSESTVNDDREALHSLLKDTYGADKTYVWVRDFDAETVWFEIESPDSAGIYGQSYERGDDGELSLTGEHHEVRIATQYVPVNPAGRTTTQESHKEDTMPQIEESRLRELEEAAGRVTTLEERATAAEERAEKAENELAEERATGRANAARALIAEHEHTFDQFQAAGLLADLPVTESGELDKDAFTKRVDEAAAKLKAAGGAGQVSGYGTPLGGTEVTESKTPTRNAWGREIKTGA